MLFVILKHYNESIRGIYYYDLPSLIINNLCSYFSKKSFTKISSLTRWRFVIYPSIRAGQTLPYLTALKVS
jgi:hypothetical protein